MADNYERYKAIVIGTGQGGKPLATALANAGWKTAIIEQLYVGGSCINYGCTPTKTMVASARIAHLARRAADYGVQVPSVTVDMTAVRKRKDAVVKSWRESGRKSLEQLRHADLIFGKAHFTGPHRVEVVLNEGGTRRLEADTIVINAGAEPVIPDIPGLSGIQALDSTSIMEMDEIPDHLIVIGGGYIGLEFGQMFRRFGSRVSIVQRGGQLLRREDADVAEEVREILEADGIDVNLNSEPRKVEYLSQKEFRITLSSSEGEKKLTGSHLLMAVGRKPATGELNLSAAGIETDKRGYIRINDKLETSVGGVYAIGDVKPGPAFTHISYDDFRVLRTNLLENGNADIRGRLVPYTVFIDPQLGRVGITEKEAGAQGRNIRAAKLPMTHVARAIETGETRGFMKAVVDADSGQVLGCAILGVEGGEIMAILQMAMMGKVPYPAIKEAIFAHPTLAESLNNLFFTLE